MATQNQTSNQTLQMKIQKFMQGHETGAFTFIETYDSRESDAKVIGIEPLVYDQVTFSDGWVKVALSKSCTKFLEEENERHFNGSHKRLKIIINFLQKEDFFEFLLMIDAVSKVWRAPIEVYMAYFPNARYDRRMSKGDSFPLKVFADAVNAAAGRTVLFKSVDVHSNVLTEMESINVKSIPVSDCFQQLREMKPKNMPDVDGRVLFVAPDEGSLQKVRSVAGGNGVISFTKYRDPLTGDIKSTDFRYPHQWITVFGVHCVIVDDICDGGYTFVQVAKKLKEAGASKVSLYVTHGIFSKGFGELFEHVDSIFAMYTDAPYAMQVGWDEVGEDFFNKFGYAHSYR